MTAPGTHGAVAAHKADGRCDPERGERAADDLARLMREKLEVAVDATALRRFLLRHWSSVEALAHIIHDNRRDGQ